MASATTTTCTAVPTTVEEEHTIEEEKECPLCYEPLSPADLRFPLVCRTATCRCSVCRACLGRWLQSSSNQQQDDDDDFSEGGIKPIRCPHCRGTYRRTVLRAVVLLRQAVELPLPTAVSDHELQSSLLSTRAVFVQKTGPEDVREALDVLRAYNKENETDTDENVEAWYSYLLQQQQQQQQQVPSETASTTTPIQSNTLSRDPTLLCGLSGYLSVGEQEYLTALLVSNNPDSIEQAAQLLHNVMMTTTTTSQHDPTHDQDELYRIMLEESHPLPTTMPRCIRLSLSQMDCFHFRCSTAASSSTLVIQDAWGPAARSGLRRGDVVTHVVGEPVTNWEDYHRCVVQQQSQDDTMIITMTVNANASTAQALRDRSIRMREEQEALLRLDEEVCA